MTKVAALGSRDHGVAELGARELAAVLRVNQIVSRHRECATLLPPIAKGLAELLPIERLLVLVPGLSEAPERVYDADGSARRPDGDDQHRQTLLARALADCASTVAEEGMRSTVALPLLARGQCVGALGLVASAGNAWDAYPGKLLDDIAAAIAVGIDNCLGYERFERMSREREVLLEVNRAIGRHLHRDELFGALAGCLRTIVPTQRFGIELPIEGDQLQGHLLTPGGAAAEPTQATVLPALGTACNWVLQNRAWIVTGTRAELREEFPVTFDVMERERMESLCALPLVTGDRCRGVLFFMAEAEGAYRHLQRDLLEQVGSAVATALDDCLAHEEVRRLRDRLAAENVYLQEEIRQDHNFGDIVGRSPALLQALADVERVAPTDSTVLILGETGTGKELIARAIHDRSPRRGRPLVKVNCGAIAAGLVESELFGHVKGAFTGAIDNRDGRFKLADGGTIFLDEVGELSPETQVKLLRVLQEREFEPIGGTRTVKVDVRVIVATNRDLKAAVRDGTFRSDLFYRLNVFPVTVPPLRERTGDVPLLLTFFMERLAKKLGKPVTQIAGETMRRLCAYAWPGNVRELQNVVERAVILSTGHVLTVEESVVPSTVPGDRPPAAVASPAPTDGAGTLEDVERRHIHAVLEQTRWKIEGDGGAAALLDLQPSTLRSRMRKLGLSRPRP
ncbi:MAG TPA: sigma 54-interacting transcriptional regulator [Candidatus Eisenbacteria bacterium]|nr:sigma 54-interacting transcriptional regulator [Candidatus Eisenbacteria bacterium]